MKLLCESLQVPLVQYCLVLFHCMKYWLVPFGSNNKEYIPSAGSAKLFQEINLWLIPVVLLRPNLPPGNHVSVGLSILCHNTLDVFDTYLNMRFPLSFNTASVWFNGIIPVTLVDHTLVLNPLSKTKLPSEPMVSWEVVGLVSGAFRLAMKTDVCREMVLYQMDMYQ